MDYDKMIEAARAEGKGTRLTVRRMVLEPKSVLRGVFLGRDLVPSKKKGFPESYSYKWDTGDGAVTCFLSNAFDKDAGGRLEVGNLYELTYLGKLQLSGGRTLKEYELIDYGSLGESGEGGEEEE